LALKSDGTLHSWGRNNGLQLGISGIEQLTIPQLVAGVSSAVDVFSGAEFSMVKFQDGTLKSFGNNDGYQLGIGVPGDLATPREMTFAW
jgi:alpha-tubulin suppressor-like RCC1 family protein